MQSSRSTGLCADHEVPASPHIQVDAITMFHGLYKVGETERLPLIYRFDNRICRDSGRHVRHTAPFALLAGMVPDRAKRALVMKGFGGKRRSSGDGPLHLVDVAVSDFRFRGLNGHQNCGCRLPLLTHSGQIKV